MTRALFLTLFVIANLSYSFSAVITKISIEPISNTTILPGEKFNFSILATYDDGKSKSIKSSSSKFQKLFTVEIDGALFNKGYVYIGKIRPSDNKFKYTVTKRDNKDITASFERQIDYFTSIRVKYEPTQPKLGEKKAISLECKANTGETVFIDKNSPTKKWEWFTINTSKGSSFENGYLIVSGDVRDFECDTVRFNIHPNKADSLTEKALFKINYKVKVEQSIDGKIGKEGRKGENAKGNGSVGGDGETGEDGANGSNIIIKMALHECNKNLVKIEVSDTVAKKTYYFIIDKNGGELDLSIRGGNGGDGGNGADGKKGKNAGKKTEAQNGGDGGNGGHGGNGGNGGSAIIYSSLNASPYIGLIKIDNKGGSAGSGGKKGKGKSGGRGNINFSDAHDGSDGNNGDDGKKGENGPDPSSITQEIKLNW